ncbi:MAG: phage major capsid protein [Gammaproteobacteria bacterium]|nr:MAG: phage major capsid protein [Gammaproteobacteria bacterium]
MTDFNFFRDGGNGILKVPTIGPYLPCTMKQLATVVMVEYSPPYEMGAIIQRSQRFLDDSMPEIITASIGEELYTRIRQLEGRAYMIGARYDEPPGVFTSQRIQRSHSDLSANAVIDLVYTLEARYRPSSAFLCSENTLREVRRLQDADGRFLYQDSLAPGVPARLIGYPCYTDPDAPDRQLMFGDFREGYRIDAQPYFTILRDPFSQKPHVLFHATHKTGGKVENDEALKILEWNNAS